MNAVPSPAAGWYDDPEHADQLRWWDGAAWTEHRHPKSPPQPVVAVAQPAPAAAAAPLVQAAPVQVATQLHAVEPVAAAAAVEPEIGKRAKGPRSRPSLSMPSMSGEGARLKVLLAVLLVAVLGGGGWYATHRGGDDLDATTPVATPADATAIDGTVPPATPADGTAGGPGTAVPKAVDTATGGGVSKAKALAAKANAAAAAADAAG